MTITPEISEELGINVPCDTNFEGPTNVDELSGSNLSKSLS